MGKIQIECIVFRKKGDDYEFLLLKRLLKEGDFWQPPCGGLEKKDKSILDGAYRELLEEANIQKEDIIREIKDVYEFEINRHYLTNKPIPVIKEVVYGFEVKPDIEISLGNNIHPEHEKFQWVSFEEALEMLKWDNNKDAFRKLRERFI